MQQFIYNAVPDTALSVLELFSTSKEGITSFASKVVTEVKEGRADALRVKLLCKTVQSIAEKIDEQTRDEQANAAARHGDKPFSYHGAELHLTATKTDYDYSVCGDTEWEMLDAQIKSLTERRKQREAFLKTLTKAEVICDQLTGEMVTIKPVAKIQFTGVKVTIK